MRWKERERERDGEKESESGQRGEREKRANMFCVRVCMVRCAKHTGPGAAITCDRSRSTTTKLRRGTDTGPGKLRQSEKAALDKPQI